MAPPLILASASRTRLELLERAGVAVTAEPAAVDETELKVAFQAEGASAEACAEALAELKAMRISARHPTALVIGADQMLECDGVWFDKPVDRAQASASLRALRGKTHELVAAVTVLRDGASLWRYVGRARLTMRPFTDGFIDAYLDALGEAALQSVGAYQLEGLGVQLFSHVDGDHFTILGLPLMPLLDFLRQHRIVPS